MTSPALGYQTRGSAAVIALPERAAAGTVFALRSRSERAPSAGHRWIAVELHPRLKSALDQGLAVQRHRGRRHLLARPRSSLKRSSGR